MPPGEHFGRLILDTNDPDRPQIRLPVNLLVKADPYLSIPAVDFGAVSARLLAADPDRAALSAQTFVVESRTPLRIDGISSTLPFVSATRDPQTPAVRTRIDVALSPGPLPAGAHEGTLTIRTDRGPLRLPFALVVTP